MGKKDHAQFDTKLELAIPEEPKTVVEEKKAKKKDSDEGE